MPNFVKDQFPSESLSSFQTSVTTAATAGPANTTAATLSNLAQSMENTPVGASVNVSHSVPNPLGNITSFAATIQQINENCSRTRTMGKDIWKLLPTMIRSVQQNITNGWACVHWSHCAMSIR